MYLKKRNHLIRTAARAYLMGSNYLEVFSSPHLMVSQAADRYPHHVLHIATNAEISLADPFISCFSHSFLQLIRSSIRSNSFRFLSLSMPTLSAAMGLLI